MRLSYKAEESFEMEMTTKERILEAACRAFADHGFRETTIAAICHAAEANIASVNYYFGSKKNLYESVWEYAYIQARNIYGFGEPGANPEEWLRQYIRNLLLMIFDEGPGGLITRLIRRDIDADLESELLKKIRVRFLKPRRQQLENAVGSILNREPASFAVRSLTSHIQAGCIFFNSKLRFREHIFGSSAPDHREVEFLIRSTQAFVEGGIEQVRSSLESGRLTEATLEGKQ
ncbi:MAG: TetR/AcrR family transcriptional regulator [Candidatus Auribacterota bacterium]|nr:TetR/AcrR family transcriptional regulator [Candidatus Auribacterota bacterium]